MELTDSNYILYCAKYYDNPGCSDISEFYEDLKRIKYLKKLLTRYKNGEDLKERLILNHLIVLKNIFPAEALVKIIFLKLEKYINYIVPFLLLLNIMPNKIIVNKKSYHIDNIVLDQKIIEILRKI